MDRKTALTAAGAIVLTIAAGTSAMAVNLGILDDGSSDRVGDLQISPSSTTTAPASDPSNTEPSTSSTVVVTVPTTSVAPVATAPTAPPTQGSPTTIDDHGGDDDSSGPGSGSDDDHSDDDSSGRGRGRGRGGDDDD
jgi:hypothetical protein